MISIGVIPLMESGPSFCTPIFRSSDFDDDKIYAQSSSDLKIIDRFVVIGRKEDYAGKYHPVFVNKSFDVSGSFVFSYINIEGNHVMGTASELLSALDLSLSLYDEYPFFQLSVVRLSGNLQWIERLKEASQATLYDMLDLRKKFSVDANLIERADKAIKTQIASIHLKEFDDLPKTKIGTLFDTRFVEPRQARFFMSDKIEHGPELVKVASLAIEIARRGGPKNPKELLFILFLYMIDMPSRVRNDQNL